MQWAEIENGKVKALKASSSLPKEGTIIPNDHQLQTGDDVRFFTRDYKRMTVEQAQQAGLITVGKNQTAEWEDGQYKVKADYREVRYWNKLTGEEIDFDIDEEPDDTMTDIEPEDSEVVWTGSGWEVPAEVKAERLRMERDMKLKECDYIIMPDYPLEDKTGWQIYRQALRDITEQTGFPDNVGWPTKPEV